MTQARPILYRPENAPADFPAWREIKPAEIPRIRFVYGAIYAAGYLTVTFAAPKTGKSLLGLAEGIDAASGQGFLTGREAPPQNVLYFNAEDDQDVLNARTVAVLQEHRIAQSEIVDRFYPVSGVSEDRSLVLIKGEKNEIQELAFTFLADFFRRKDITLAIFDPLQDLSQSPETNEAFRALGARIRRLATETGVAIGMIHHTRKPNAGIQLSLDDGRGGSALRGIARFNRLLAPMTEVEGAQAGVDDFRHYFRIAEAESNLAPPSSDRNQWFEKTGVEIGNGAAYPTIRKWIWPEVFAGVTVNHACRVRAMIAEKAANDEPPRENVQAQNWAGRIVAEAIGLDLGKTSDKARVKSILRTWTETGVLRVEVLPFGKKSKTAKFVLPGPNDPTEVSE